MSAALLAVEALTRRMQNTPVLSAAEVDRLSKKHMASIWPAIRAGKSYGEASGGVLGFLSGADPQAQLKSIEHDLGAQAEIAAKSFDEYLKRGEIPAPYYPMRIAILLSKAGNKEQEKAFLAAWCKHFGSARNSGGKYGKLAERARKLGAYR